jgi:uncharacterized Zn finger protein (UPF0148 family)
VGRVDVPTAFLPGGVIDTDMSDFDKEAERERLREKYERDKKKRETTERMSELLLKGATMTDAHCENCGDPVFRYEGEEFCPTCQQLVTTDADADADAGEPETGERESDAGEPDASGTEAASDGPASGDRDLAETDATGSAAGRRPTAGQPATPAASRSPGATTGDDQSDGALEEARASLTRALRFHASQAAETADPRRARDHLAAAREAAEALSALY